MQRLKILGLSGNVSRPSRTASLVRAITAAVEKQFDVDGQVIELADAAPVLFRALRADQLDKAGRDIIDAVEAADILVVGSPVYRASYTGALKHLFDLVHFRALTGKHIILAATGGTQLHGLVTEHQLRPLFGFFNALTIPTALYATEPDFAGHELTSPDVAKRINSAVSELAQLFHSAGSSLDSSRTSPQLDIALAQN